MATNLKNVDLNLLVIFEAVYATGNISRAADRLAMSQPAVSNALARLRDVVDDPLFVRSARGVEPTARSREMIRPVRDALGLIGRQFAGEEIDLATYKRLFRIMLIDVIEPIMMPAVIRTVTEQAPGIEIECVHGHSRFADDIRAGTLDLACFTFPIDTRDIVVQAVCPTDVVAVTRRNHPDIKRPLDLETFERLSHVALGRELRGLSPVDQSLVANGIKRRVVYMVAKVWSIAPIVQRTDLMGMLTRKFAEEIAEDFQLDIHDLPMKFPEQHVYMMWHVNNEHDPGHRWLRESMIQATLTNQ